MLMNRLLEEWMAFQSSRGRSPTTLHGYENIIEQHLAPTIGSIPIGKLSAHHLDTLYAERIRSGKSARTVRNIHNVISASLNQAVRWSWLERNIAEKATLPTVSPTRVIAPSVTQTRQIIEACQSHDEKLGAFVFLAAVTGCRRGEIAALRWSSLVDGAIVIRGSVYSISGEQGIKSTKSGRERIVQIDPEVVAWLERWRKRCSALADDWGVTLDVDGYIISSRPDGSRFVELDSISHAVRRITKTLGLPEVHLHSLRHFAATELIGSGVSARDTAEMLGHADPALTLRVYSHANVERQRAAAAILSTALTPPVDRKGESMRKL
jgi:integrase